MDKKKLQRLTLERLIAYRKYHAKAIGLATSMARRSLKDEAALAEIGAELERRSSRNLLPGPGERRG
jgi:hypothetical protein